MSETHNILKKVSHLEISPELDGYSRVVIYAGQDENGGSIVYEAGTDTGKTLEIKNEWGTEQMARDILERIRGWQYQPYEARGAILDPAAELGDGVTVDGVYSGVFLRSADFGPLMSARIGAPIDREIEHEFTLESPTDRTYSRFVRQTRSMLTLSATQIRAEVEARTQMGEQLQSRIDVNAENIQAKVSKTGSNEGNTFGWNLAPDSWTLFSGSENNAVLRATPEGLEVRGIIRADAGYIGGEKGFVITASAIYSNIPLFGGSQNQGVYIGTNGIQLGSGFRVDSGGNLYAASGTFGSLTVNGSGRTTGTYVGSLSGCGGSVSGLGGSLSTGINVGGSSIGTYVGNIVADKINADYVRARVGDLKNFKFNSHTVRERWITDGDGNLIQVLVTQS